MSKNRVKFRRGSDTQKPKRMIHSSYGPKRPQQRNIEKRLSLKTHNYLHNDVLKLIYPHNRLEIEVTPSKAHEKSAERDIPFVQLSSNAQNNLIDKDTVSGFLKTSKFSIPNQKPKPNTANPVPRRKIAESKIELRNSNSKIVSPEVLQIAQFYEGPTKVGFVDYETTFGMSTPDDSFLAFGISFIICWASTLFRIE